MKSAIEEIEATQTYNHLPLTKRVSMFTWKRKWRFFWLFVICYMWTAWGNGLGSIFAKFERMFKKYKIRWISRYNPDVIAFTTARETQWEPEKMSRQSTDRLSEAFVRIDRELPHGFSRELIIYVMLEVSKFQS